MTIEENLSPGAQESIKDKFSRTRGTTYDLCRPLERDDYMIQSTPDTSPPKWHLGHTTWFFENFILKQFMKGYREFDPNHSYVFNSYYETVGRHIPKPLRATISRPSLEKVIQYREAVSSETLSLMEECSDQDRNEIFRRVVLGINHEEQHQELLLMDIKRNFFSSPYRPAYTSNRPERARSSPLSWIGFPETMEFIGHGGPAFSFDNETPRHRELIHAFSIANRPVTNGEYIRFIEDGGYSRPELWLSAGWDMRIREQWEMPLYWSRDGDTFTEFTMSGTGEVDPEAPVIHVSYYEADAFARWSGCRLPTEIQWEHAAASGLADQPSNFLEEGHFSPLPVMAKEGRISGIGNAWEWTGSAYLPYPGFRPLPGSLGEYNGKFMSGQMVLRGSSFSTPRGHSRATYRNFYHPGSRWQFSGIRLGRDGSLE